MDSTNFDILVYTMKFDVLLVLFYSVVVVESVYSAGWMWLIKPANTWRKVLWNLISLSVVIFGSLVTTAMAGGIVELILGGPQETFNTFHWFWAGGLLVGAVVGASVFCMKWLCKDFTTTYYGDTADTKN